MSCGVDSQEGDLRLSMQSDGRQAANRKAFVARRIRNVEPNTDRAAALTT
jgi:hypothetical protein